MVVGMMECGNVGMWECWDVECGREYGNDGMAGMVEWGPR